MKQAALLWLSLTLGSAIGAYMVDAGPPLVIIQSVSFAMALGLLLILQRRRP